MKNKQTPRQVLNLPAGYFGMVLDAIEVGFAWCYASTLWPVNCSTGDDLVMLAVAMWTLFSVAFISRAVRLPAGVLRGMHHPVSSSLVSLLPVTTLLAAVGLMPWWRPLALGPFMPGVALQLAYATRQSGGLWRGTHPREAAMPGLYLLTVANNFINTMTCDALGFTDAELVLPDAGVFSWLSFEPAILQHLRSTSGLLTPLRTSLGIQLAPVLVACSAWLSVSDGEVDTLAELLFDYDLLQLLFMPRLVPWYLRQPPNTSFWSLPLSISALAATGLHLSQARANGFFHHLAMPLFTLSNLVVDLLLLRTTLLSVSGKLLVQVDRETLLNKKEGS